MNEWIDTSYFDSDSHRFIRDGFMISGIKTVDDPKEEIFLVSEFLEEEKSKGLDYVDYYAAE